MSDLKITQFDAATTRANTDIVPIVINPASTPANRKITIADFLGTNLTQIAALNQSNNSGKFLTTDGTSFSLVNLVGVNDGDKGDILVSSSGTVWTVDNGVITEPKIANEAVTSLKIADGAILNSKIANDAVTASKIANDAVTASKIANDAVTASKIANDAVTSAKIADGAVSNAKLANMATARFKGRISSGSGEPEDLTGTEATTLLDVFTSSLKGLVPASGGSTTDFLRADGTWTAPGLTLPFSGTNAFRTTGIDYGEITLSFDDQSTHRYMAVFHGGNASDSAYMYLENLSSGHTTRIRPNSITMFYNDWHFILDHGQYLRFEDTNLGAELSIYASHIEIGGSQVLGERQPAIENLSASATLGDTIDKVNEILAMLRTHGLIDS